MTAQLDILVIGDDEPSLCAAACAARAGAATGLVAPPRGGKPLYGASAPGIPNDVWRRLELHEYALSLAPVSARVTLFEDKVSLATGADPRETGETLAGDGVEGHDLWTDFIEEMRALGREDILSPLCAGASADAAAAILRLFEDDRAMARAGRLSGPCAEILADFFKDARLKDHVAAHALSRGGLSGVEAGSAATLGDCLNETAWPVRPGGGAKALGVILREACEKAGVQFFDGPVEPAPQRKEGGRGAKYRTLSVNGHDRLKTRYVFFASPAAAERAGAASAALGGAVGSGRTATAVMRFKLADGAEPPAGDAQAIFQIVDESDDMRRARDAAVSGRLPDKLPVEFEFNEKGDIVARTAYCPAAFCEEGEQRPWTSQDRQAVAARIRERLTSRMPGLAEAIRSTRIEVTGPPEQTVFAYADDIIIQPARHDAIGAAVRLIDRVMNGEH